MVQATQTLGSNGGKENRPGKTKFKKFKNDSIQCISDVYTSDLFNKQVILDCIMWQQILYFM